ncbi:translation initiation factor IF-2 N-terminal domain-containing protein [Micropruina glycogenica]|nr:translation initiation factor IF-2 N-terminal domain-containing protein [Micropruina glycogenica]
MRVYELAKKLDRESKELLSQLKQMGEFVRSASSTIEAPVVQKLIDRLQGTGSDSAAPVIHRRPRAASNESKGSPRRGNNPFSSTTVDGPLPRRQTPRRSESLPSSIESVPDEADADEDAIARYLGVGPRRSGASKRRPSRPRPGSIAPAKTNDPWALNWFDAEEKKLWLEAGVYDAQLAGDASDAGLGPDDVKLYILVWNLTVAQATYAKRLDLTDDDLSRMVGDSNVGEYLQRGHRMDWIHQLERDIARTERYRNHRGHSS